MFECILFSVNELSGKKSVMQHKKRNMRRLKVRQYADHMIYLNKYLDVIPRVNISENLYDGSK